jgi:hypothetical protein
MEVNPLTKVLIIEDERPMAEAIKFSLGKESRLTSSPTARRGCNRSSGATTAW